VLNELNLTFEEAGSQQSKDFRNVGGIGLDIEIKKTDNTVIYFNDTCPSDNIYYIVIFTGKIYKRQSEKNIPPQVLYLNGADFLTDCDWLEEFITELNALKDKYARGDNKKMLSGIMSVYPRPTFKADISDFLCSEIY
jgi:sorbitol-specific phosphotransferase system component IIA